MTAQLHDLAEPLTEQRAAIAYVMTHYPRVALTFISGEIDALERRGIMIEPFAMNMPTDADLRSNDLKLRRDRTTYLKTSWLAALGAFFGEALRHPLALSRLVARAVATSRGNLGRAVRRIAHLVEATSLAKECGRRGVMHIHAHFGQAPATIAWFASEILNFSQRSRASWSFTIHGFQDFVDDADTRLDLKAASAAFVICISDFSKSQLCRITPSKLWPHFHVVRCGIDLEKFAFRGERALSAKPLIVTVGRLSPEKGQSILIQAVAALRAQGIDVELKIIGDGPLKNEIWREVSSLGLEERITLAGELPAEEVYAQLQLADVFCLPSFAEGLPVSIMEAMAVGVPVVSTDVGGIPELAIEGTTALTVNAGDVEALATALSLMITDHRLRRRAVQAAREEVVKHHDRERNADQLASLFIGRDVKAL